MSKLFIGLGACNAFIAVAAGAFAAHKLKSSLSEYYLDVFRTAVEYQFYHALGLVIVGLLLNFSDKPALQIAGWLMFVGIILFSGSLYTLVLTQTKWLGIITPIGGSCFLVAWLIIAYNYLIDLN